MARLKSVFYFISFIVLLNSCQSGAGNYNRVAHLDSLNELHHQSLGPSPEILHYQSEIDSFYQKYFIRSGFNGSLLVAKDGKVIYEKYKGYSDFSKKDTLTSVSAFHLASVSKTFTAMAILKLVEKNKLHLEDSLQKFFPDFPYKGVTVKLLLSHRSGLPNYLYFMEHLDWPRDSMCTNQDVLNYMITYTPPLAANPDRHFQYCNTNYVMLALIIEQVSGMSFEQFLKVNFFDPLGMKDTYVFDFQRDHQTAMPSYNERGVKEAYTFLDLCYGDKNIYSTAADLLKWDQALYDPGFFSEKLLEPAFTPYSNEKPGVRNYGLGWRMNVYANGRKVIYHNGWWHGNNTVFIRDIENKVTIIALGNKFNKNIYQSKRIAEIFEQGLIIED